MVIKHDMWRNCPSLANSVCHKSLNSLSNDNILDVTKLKALTDGNLNVATIMIFLFDRLEKTLWENDKMPVTHSVFQTLLPSFLGLLKVGIVW